MTQYRRSLASVVQRTYQSSNYECEICRDEEYVLVDGWKAKPCECQAKKLLKKRMANAGIPHEYADANLDTFVPRNEVQAKMLGHIQEYLAAFESIKDTKQNSFGFLATIGETRIREVKDTAKRVQYQREYNNYGIGKTHLTVAAGKKLIERGYSVLIVSDVTVMDHLARSKANDDDGQAYNKTLHAILECDVLVWDDLAKSKHSEAKEKIYFRIFDERFERRKPIIFTSNEDDVTLADRIGAAASRILGMCGKRRYAISGPDIRMEG
jgi:DNA replication protein DnaC